MEDMRRRLVVLAVFAALAVTGCTGTSHPRATASHGGLSVSRTPSVVLTYSVAAQVQTIPKGTSVLCGPIEAGGGGPAVCGHTRVIGMPAKVVGSHTVDGYTRTPVLRLNGTWQRGVLTLVEPPAREPQAARV